jgi:hypothetical protein
MIYPSDKFTMAVTHAKAFISDMMGSAETVSSTGVTMAIVPFGDRVAVDTLNSVMPIGPDACPGQA